ncbi:hypothetical protein STEG23_028430, partial [Scotinomys teguina]
TPTSKFEFFLVLIFATEEINRNPYLLPNMTLRFTISIGTCFDTMRLIDMVYSPEDVYLYHPNYKCGMDIFFGPFHHILNDNVLFPKIYQIAHKNSCLPKAMVSLMLYFTWTWVGLVVSNDDQGIQFLSDLREEMQRNGVCLAFVNMIPDNMQLYTARAAIYDKEIMTSSAKVAIIYGEMNSTLEVSFRRWGYLGVQKIWVTTSQWDVTTIKKDFSFDLFKGTVTFAHHHDKVSEFMNVMQTMNTSICPVDISQMITQWNNYNCSVSESNCSSMNHSSFNTALEWFSQHKFDMVLSEEGYNLYNAVYVVAHTYHEIILQQVESQTRADLIGIFYDCHQSQQLHISDDLEHTMGATLLPTSACSMTCSSGFRKFHEEQEVDCCFHCALCPENEVSNETVDGDLRCFQLLAITNSAAMNIVEYVFLLYDEAFLGYMPKSSIIES